MISFFVVAVAAGVISGTAGAIVAKIISKVPGMHATPPDAKSFAKAAAVGAFWPFALIVIAVAVMFKPKSQTTSGLAVATARLCTCGHTKTQHYTDGRCAVCGCEAFNQYEA